MAILSFSNRSASFALSTRGAALMGWWLDGPDGRLPLLRLSATEGAATDMAAFPLVPFGNRIGGNAFTFGGRTHRVRANTADACRLHGDGWLSEWAVEAVFPEGATLVLEHAGDDDAPWSYRARQSVTLDERSLVYSLEVENTGDALPFGLGWHPYLTLTPESLLVAPATAHWIEGPGFLPTVLADLPEDLDLSAPRPLPDRWINAGFEGWTGRARLTWPERRLALDIASDPPVSRYVLFRPDRAFVPDYAGDWFCFEPMSHSPDGFRLADLGGLAPLAPGGRLALTVRLTAVEMPHSFS